MWLVFQHKALLILIFVVLLSLLGRANAPQDGIWQAVLASVGVKYAEASDMPLCKVNLASLSKTSGAPGDVFEMYGEWEDTQGTKTAAINMGRGNKLEILSWTSKALGVRIPKGLKPGAYKVGVYCNNPPHWQGSGFKDFMVIAPAFEDVQKNGAPLAASESSAPLAANGATLQSKKDVSIPADASAPTQKQKTAHNEPANSGGDVVGAVINKLFGMLAELGLRAGILIAASVVALLFLLRFFRPKIDADAQVNEKAHAGKPHEHFGVGLAEAKGFEPLHGVNDSVEYAAEELGEVVLGNVFEPTVTVHIDAKGWTIKRPMEINARKIRPLIAHDSRATDINLLLDAGVTYIDIGYSTDWVAAELPLNRIAIDRSLVEQVVGYLIRIRKLS